MPELAIIPKQFQCPKCGHDKASTRFTGAPSTREEIDKRRRMGLPIDGEIITQVCALCGYGCAWRPLDYQPAAAAQLSEEAKKQ